MPQCKRYLSGITRIGKLSFSLTWLLDIILKVQADSYEMFVIGIMRQRNEHVAHVVHVSVVRPVGAQYGGLHHVTEDIDSFLFSQFYAALTLLKLYKDWSFVIYFYTYVCRTSSRKGEVLKEEGAQVFSKNCTWTFVYLCGTSKERPCPYGVQSGELYHHQVEQRCTTG